LIDLERVFIVALRPFFPQVIPKRVPSDFAGTARSSPRRLPCQRLRKEQATPNEIQAHQAFPACPCASARGAMREMFQNWSIPPAPALHAGTPAAALQQGSKFFSRDFPEHVTPLGRRDIGGTRTR